MTGATVLFDKLRVCLARPTLLTIGVFDGVHLGHQHLIGEMRQRAIELRCLAGVITLYPHPRQVLGNGDFVPAFLTSLNERIVRLRSQGIDWIARLHFDTSVAQTTAADFMKGLMACMPVAELWAGPDFALGRAREGDLSHLGTIGNELGFKLRIASPLSIDGKVVSSTRIRGYLAEGDVAQAGRLLGLPFTLPGQVVAGFQRGRGLGFPTANLEPSAGLLVPANGVYAAYASWQGQKRPAVVNIGTRPTFDNGRCSIEAHILDVNVDLYGQDFTIEFVQRLRGEKAFPDSAGLVAQIETDVQQARHILNR